MNIIQQQDRLKSLPEEVLIEYIANPTGEVPTFLALGEIERRKVMRNKYAAQQAEQPPVVEQIVQESMAAKMPRPMDMVGGLGRSNRQEALRRETAPPMPSSGDAGITALPAPNVGQNYAQGGVVGYAAGDYVVLTPAQKELLKQKQMEDAARLQQVRDSASSVSSFITEDIPNYSPQILFAKGLENISDPNFFNNIGSRAIDQSTLVNPKEATRGLNESPDDFAVRQYMSEQANKENPSDNYMISNLSSDNINDAYSNIMGTPANELTQAATVPQEIFGGLPEASVVPNVVSDAGTNVVSDAGTDAISDAGKDAISDARKDAISEAYLTPYERYRQSQADYGMDENYYTRLREDIESDRDLVRDRSDVANMALINAGLGIASGTSQNALENIARGAVPGLTSYTQGLKDLRDDERSIRKELRGVDALQRGESREDRMFDTKLRTELEAARIAGGVVNKELQLKARDSAMREAKLYYPDAASVSQTLVDSLNYKGPNAKEMYLKDYISALQSRNLGNKLTDREKELIDSILLSASGNASASGNTTGYSARLIK